MPTSWWTRGPVLPVDRIHSAFNLLLAGLWVGHAWRSQLALPLCLLHLTGAAMPLLLGIAPTPLSRSVAIAREYYPLLWLESYWMELGVLLPLLHPVTHDPMVLHLENALRFWGWQAPRAPDRLVNEVMYLFYASYLPLLVLTPIVCGLLGRVDIIRDYAWRVSLVALVCFTMYLVWPVAGPGYAEGGLPPVTGPLSGGVRAIRALGDARGSAFPSSHVAISCTIALVLWHWLPRRVALGLAGLVVGIAVACVYTRNHYLVDVLAGVALAGALHGWQTRSPCTAASRMDPMRGGQDVFG